MISSVIFDMDGTLVNSNDLHARAWQEAFRQFGKHIPFEQIRAQLGKGADQTMPMFFSEAEIRRFGDELYAYKTKIYRGKYMPQVTAFPRVRELFERLKQDGKRIALATSAAREELHHNLELIHVDGLVDAMTSESDAARTKPFPDVFLSALKKLHEPPRDEVMIVGDSPYDGQAAGQIPVPWTGLLCGGFSEQELRGNGCVAIYRDPADLLDQYDSSPLAK